jgi:hypothetical protein
MSRRWSVNSFKFCCFFQVVTSISGLHACVTLRLVTPAGQTDISCSTDTDTDTDTDIDTDIDTDTDTDIDTDTVADTGEN